LLTLLGQRLAQACSPTSRGLGGSLPWKDKAQTGSWLTSAPCRGPGTDHLRGWGGNVTKGNFGEPGKPQLLPGSPEIKQADFYKSLIMAQQPLIAAINMECNKCTKQKCKGTGHCRANLGICGLPAPTPLGGSRGQVTLQASSTHRSLFRPWESPED